MNYISVNEWDKHISVDKRDESDEIYIKINL